MPTVLSLKLIDYVSVSYTHLDVYKRQYVVLACVYVHVYVLDLWYISVQNRVRERQSARVVNVSEKVLYESVRYKTERYIRERACERDYDRHIFELH